MSKFRLNLALALCIMLCGAAKRPQPITTCAFTPDSSSIVIAHHDSVIVRSVADASQTRSLDLNLKRVSAIAFDPGGKLLAVAGGVPGASGSVALWDWQANTLLGEAGEFQDIATAVAFSPDGRRLAVASADKSAKLFDVRDNGKRIERTAVLTGHAGPVQAIAFAPDAFTVLTASADRSLKLWEAQSGRLIRTFTNHIDSVHCLAVRSTNEADKLAPWVAASAGDDKTVRIWQPGFGRMVRIIRRHEKPIFALAYSPDGSKLFSAGAEGIVRMIDADSDQIVGEFKAHDDWIHALAVSADGKWLATGDWSGGLRLWDLGGKSLKRIW